jgi:hypothetical protein
MNKAELKKDNSKLIKELSKRYSDLSHDNMLGDEGRFIEKIIIALSQSNIKIDCLIDLIELKEKHISELATLISK